ncbi:MAG: TonB-dependent receptor [Deltaproteobacteria bacterium]|nr:MAG: TonB-dependent receptor [Deltaproteobacteria bacterium]
MRRSAALFLALSLLACRGAPPGECVGDRTLGSAEDVEAFVDEHCTSLTGTLFVFASGTVRLDELERVETLVLTELGESVQLDLPVLAEVEAMDLGASLGSSVSLPELASAPIVIADLPELALPSLTAAAEIEARGRDFAFPSLVEVGVLDVEATAADVTSLREADFLRLMVDELPALDGLERADELIMRLPETALFTLPALVSARDVEVNRALSLPLLTTVGDVRVPNLVAPQLTEGARVELIRVDAATDLGSLATVELLTLGVAADSFVIPELASGDLDIYQGAVTVSAPKLAAGSVTTGLIDELLLPALVDGGTLDVHTRTSVSLPALTTASSLTAASEQDVLLPALRDVGGRLHVQVTAGVADLQALANAGSVSVESDGDVSLPALATTTELFFTVPTTASVSVPSLRSSAVLTVRGGAALDLGSNGSITSASLLDGSYTSAQVPWATQMELLELGYTALTSADLAGVARIETLALASEPLTTVTAADLTSLGDLGVQTPAVSTFDAPQLTSLNGILTIVDDSQLPGCTVAQLVDAATAGGGTIASVPTFSCP